VLVIGRHQSGCISSLEVVGGEARPAFLFELRGESGKIMIEGHFPGGYQAGDLVVTTDFGAEPPPAATSPGLAGPPANVSELYAGLVRDIRAGTRTVPDFDRAVRLTRLLDAIDMASDTGRRVALAP
jgi:predicted dehydrogenase